MVGLDVQVGVPLQSVRRNRTFALLAAAWTFLLMVMLPAALLAGALRGEIDFWSDLLLWCAAFLGAMFGARYCWSLTRGLWNASLLIGEHEIVVNNPRKTYRVPLNEVSKFVGRANDVGFGNPIPGLALVRTSGEAIFVWTLASEGFVWNQERSAGRWEALAQQLNARVAQLRS